MTDALVWSEPQNYTRSEAIARRASAPFAKLSVDLGDTYNLHVFAHSMGNYVVSEALKRETTNITTYVATQSATEAESYAPYHSKMDVSQPLTQVVQALDVIPDWLSKTSLIANLVATASTYNPETFVDAWNYANTGAMPPDLFNQTPTVLLEIANAPLPYYFNGIKDKTNFVNL